MKDQRIRPSGSLFHWVFCLALLAFAPLALAQALADPSPKADGDPISSEQPSLKENRVATIAYGLDQDILDLLKELQKEGDDSFNQDLLAIVARSKNKRLKSGILDFMGQRAWPGADEYVVRLLGDYQNEDSTVVQAALSYGAKVKSETILAAGLSILDNDEKEYLSGLVWLLGMAGGQGQEERLLALLAKDDINEGVREDIVKVLGSCGGPKAIVALRDIMNDGAQKKFIRLYACESLGKLRDEDSLEAFVTAANGEDPNLRAYAVQALGYLKNEASRVAIVEAMRDSYEAVRINACKALALQKGAGLFALLSYKVVNDKSVKVREEALRAMSAIGGEENTDYLARYLTEIKNPANLRCVTLELLVQGEDINAHKAVMSALERESKEKQAQNYQRMAKIVGEKAVSSYSDLALSLMRSPDYIVRCYGIDWARRNNATGLRSELVTLQGDKVELVRKRANAALAALH